VQLIRELEATRDETLRYFSLGQQDLMRTYGPGKWSVLFVLHHLSDSETVLFDRIRRVLSEPRQVLWVYDQDAWAKGLDYSQVPLDLSRRVYEAVRGAIIYYAGRYYEPKGHLEFVHSVMGVRTLKDEFDKVASHNEHHLSQIRLALEGR
jgi:DinB family protein